MDIKYTKINSSNIVGYFYNHPEKKLYIKFKNEREYLYFNVSHDEFKNLINADSFGKELYSKIVNKKKFEEIW